jgi:hypothetical protein
VACVVLVFPPGSIDELEEMSSEILETGNVPTLKCFTGGTLMFSGRRLILMAWLLAWRRYERLLMRIGMICLSSRHTSHLRTMKMDAKTVSVS